MAISSAGIGSGLDVTSLVSQLVAAERAPAAGRIERAQSKLNVSLSAMGMFKNALAMLQSSAQALTGTGTAFGRMKSTVSAEGFFTATASSGAVAGKYGIEIIDVARAHKLTTTAYAGGSSTVLGAGSVTIGVGGEDFTVELDSASATLADLRDAINSATDNASINAVLITEDAGTRLVLTSREEGTANAITFNSTASGGGSLVTTSTLQAATDAQIKVEGYTYTSSSNTVTSAIEGVTLNLLKAEPGTTLNVTLTPDTGSASSAVKGLVTAYNALMDLVSKYGSYDATTKSGGPLMGESSVRVAMQQIRRVLGDSIGDGTYATLASVGITSDKDGKLKLDATKLDAALASDSESIGQLFSGSNGFATRLDTVLDGFVGDNGRIGSQTEQLTKRLKALDDQTAALDRRMAMVEARYRKQFVALDTLLGQMQSTSSYLTQQLASLPGSSSG